jgi:glycosyltransferase involved in cell wall biosynthesis
MSERLMTLHMLVFNEMFSGVVVSQTITPARVYAETFPNLSVSVSFLEPARVALTRRARARLKELREMLPGGRVNLFPYMGRLGPYAPAYTLRSALLAKRRGRGGGVVFHCRGPEATIQAAWVAKRSAGRVIFDSRGPSDLEATLRLAKQGRGGDAALLERSRAFGLSRDQTAAKEADAIITVSEVLARKVRSMLEGAEKPMAIIPCCIPRPLFSASGRDEVRRRLGVGDGELLLVHTSTSSYWEAFDNVVALFRCVAKRRPAKLLFLTELDPSVVTASLPQDDPLRDSIIVHKAPPEEVPDYLSAADVGLLLRKPHEAFRASSPIKFTEYLGAGLATVVSSGIGGTEEIVRSRRVGVVVPELLESAAVEDASAGLIDLLGREGGDLRRRSIEVCRELFLWKSYTPVISRLYGLS